MTSQYTLSLTDYFVFWLFYEKQLMTSKKKKKNIEPPRMLYRFSIKTAQIYF